MANNISSAVINRLPRYYRYLGDLKDSGIERISSQELSKKMNVTASQIRQDFNNFGGFGQQGYGYNIEVLYTEIGKILGLNKNFNIIIIGAGNLGQAIANYRDFQKRGFTLVGIFDVNPRFAGVSIRDIPIKSMDELEETIKNKNVQIVALTLPRQQAPKVAHQCVDAGIKAIWNFAPIDLNLPEDIIVENVHLAESLMQLSYALTAQENTNQEESDLEN